MKTQVKFVGEIFLDKILNYLEPFLASPLFSLLHFLLQGKPCFQFVQLLLDIFLQIFLDLSQ